jgi:hypothetical protein
MWVHGDGSFIHFANDGDGISAYTLDGGIFTNRGHIKIVTHMPPDLGSARGIFCAGGFIYVANYRDGLRIFTFAGGIYTPVAHYRFGGSAYGVWVDGNNVYVAQWDGILAFTFDGVNLIFRDRFDPGGQARSVFGYGGNIFLANGNDGIYGLSFDGLALTEEGHRDDGDYYYGVSCDADFIYVGNRDAGLRVYSVPAPASLNPKFMSFTSEQLYQPFF